MKGSSSEIAMGAPPVGPAPSGRSYRHLQRRVLALPRAEQQHLFFALRQRLFPPENPAARALREIRERRHQQGLLCPHCQSKAVRNGTQKGRQRYRCKEGCGRSFGDFTLTPLDRTRRPELWPAFIEHFFAGHSQRKSAALLGVSHVVLFYWRHKLLRALLALAEEDFSGILEADETFLRYSQKGARNLPRKGRKRGAKAKKRGISRDQACVLVVRDRARHTRTRVVGRGPLSCQQAQDQLGSALGAVTALCTDDAAAYKPLAAGCDLEHVVLSGSRKERVKRGVYHIQNVNAFHARFKAWLEPFQGVATKYLSHYLAWFGFVEKHRLQALAGKTLELLAGACQSPQRATWNELRRAPCPFASVHEDPRHLLV